jgi:hypothetical protein
VSARLFLGSDDASYVNGTPLAVDGGHPRLAEAQAPLNRHRAGAQQSSSISSIARDQLVKPGPRSR